MSSKSDTSAIDEKKKKETIIDDKLFINIFKFLIILLIIILIFVFNFSLGGIVLYGCKVGQSNILPTNDQCMPYESNNIEISEIPINIFETVINEQSLSQKIIFPYAKNKKNIILDMLREYKEKPSSNIVFNYFISIIESIFVFNFTSLSVFLNLLNQLPEYLILIFGPGIMMIFTSIIFGIDFIYIIYLWFYQMSWFFSVNSNDSGKPKWETTLNPARLYIGGILVFLFSMGFWVGLVTFPFVLSIISFICIFTILTCKGEMNNKEVSVWSIIKDVFKYNKVLVSSIISFFVVLSAFINLGRLASLFSILTVLLIYFNVLPIGIFTSINQENLTKSVSYEQASRKCEGPTNFGFMSWVKSFIGGGKKITNEIKKIGKHKIMK